MKKNKKDKDLKKLDVSNSLQMNLFEITGYSISKHIYSNTIELYDALPKYVWEQKKKNISNAIITRKCIIRNKKIIVKIKPAIIEKENGSTVLIYAGQREEILEDALRKLATNGSGNIIEGKAGITFTLYELQKELKKMGHGYNINEIKESIQVCRGATLECIIDGGKSLISSSFFPMIGLTSKNDFYNKNGNIKCYVQFNPLVNESIINLTFRQYNYKIGMQIRSPLSRYIYKRMSHYWIQAHYNSPYTPSLISFLTQSPRELSSRMSENIRAMKNAFDILIKKEIISNYISNKIKKGKKIIDIRYIIYPHKNFVKQIIHSNKNKQKTKIKARNIGIKIKKQY